MDFKEFNDRREELNNLMQGCDDFFEVFGGLDDHVYADGAIPKKYKELTGLAISVLSKCEECILYHVQNCVNEGTSKDELVEAIKIAVIGGGSITYPSARFAFKAMKELGII